MSLLIIEKSKNPFRRTHWNADYPLLQLGFRPFYLLAAMFSTVAVPYWIAKYFGWLPDWPSVGLNWHMHEMVFGMALAVIIGFLYTAARNWTGLSTPRNTHLAALAGLWIAGRLAMLFGPEILAAVVDLFFLALATWPLYRVLKKSGNKRNLFLVALLGMLMLTNVIFHAAVLGWINASSVMPIQSAILIMTVIESVIGARVIPMFTTNGAPGTTPIVNPKRDSIALWTTIAACLAWIGNLPAPLIAGMGLAAACAILVRVTGWKLLRTTHVPLLWILHLSYGWIAIGFFLLALAALNIVPASAAFHALTVGAMAGLIIGMITRTTLGHSGRKLATGKTELAMYLLIQFGAIARVVASIGDVGTIGRIDMRNTLLIVAALCWSVAFLGYVVKYGPYLFRPRIDGREG